MLEPPVADSFDNGRVPFGSAAQAFPFCLERFSICSGGSAENAFPAQR